MLFELHLLKLLAYGTLIMSGKWDSAGTAANLVTLITQAAERDERWVAHPAAGQEVGPIAGAAAVGHLREALPPRLVRAGAEDVRLGRRAGSELHGVQAGRVHCPHGHAAGQLLSQILLNAEKADSVSGHMMGLHHLRALPGSTGPWPWVS